MSAAPPQDVHILFNEVCHVPWIVGLDAKALGRVRLLHLSSPRGADLEACADPSFSLQKKTHTSRTLRQFRFVILSYGRMPIIT